MPQLIDRSLSSDLPGLWWAPLPSEHEVWWRNIIMSWNQNYKEVEQCKHNPPIAPAFFSDEKSTCDYEWLLAVLNLETWKIRYLVPIKKVNQVKGTQDFYDANISPDGKHIVVLHRTQSANNGLRASSSIEVRSMETQKIEGRYSVDTGINMQPVFSGDSRYFALPVNTTSYSWDQSALIFELPKNK